jgi:hypothetical protein
MGLSSCAEEMPVIKKKKNSIIEVMADLYLDMGSSLCTPSTAAAAFWQTIFIDMKVPPP